MSEPTDDSTLVAPLTADERPAAKRAERPPPSEPRLADRYALRRRIGKGGMGEVMGAHDEQIGRDVAIKRMRAAAPRDREIDRFLREAKIQGRLEHPAIVPVHEIGRDSDGLPFFVMKKLTGTTLARILETEGARFPLQRVLRAFAEVCLAVEFAHVRGIVHRDLKPDNIVLGDFGEVYVLDWGVAKVLGEDDGGFADVDSGSGEHATAVGTAIGTPGYMAPEQIHGLADIDGRADIYTLGCVLFELLAGEPLHPRGRLGLDSALGGCDARPSARAPERRIAPELDALCVEATRPDRATRLASARELADRVLRYLDGDRDLALRHELARGHLERARAAFARGDVEAERRAAMREAAAALALDPALDGAAALVGRLMLEPPTRTPPEVDAAITGDEVRMARVHALAGLWTLVATTAFSPLMWWLAPAGSPYVAAFTAILAVNGALCLAAYKAATPRPGLIVIGNAVMVALLALMFSPLLIAPGIAAALAIAMVLTPRFTWLGSGAAIAALLIAAVLVPFGLERVGVLPITMAVETGSLAFRAPAIAGREGPALVVGVLYAIGLIAGASAMAAAMRRRIRTAHHHLHMQAWQLRQLVPQ